MPQLLGSCVASECGGRGWSSQKLQLLTTCHQLLRPHACVSFSGVELCRRWARGSLAAPPCHLKSPSLLLTARPSTLSLHTPSHVGCRGCGRPAWTSCLLMDTACDGLSRVHPEMSPDRTAPGQRELECVPWPHTPGGFTECCCLRELMQTMSLVEFESIVEKLIQVLWAWGGPCAH